MAAPPPNSFPRSPNMSNRSYDSSSVSSAASPKPPAHYLGGFMNTSARPGGPPLNMPPLPSVTQGFQPYSSMGRDSLNSNDSVTSTPGSAHMGLSSQSTGPQKRAYRQRRKDPSCDACRERKVKCDATETTSCSECSSRNVKCQFTKETNRRMSSIKQVQDLEKQMERVKRENNNLRRIVQDRDDGSMSIDLDSADQAALQLPTIGSEPKRRRARHGHLPELARARANARPLSKGLWKLPPQYRVPILPTFNPPRPELPPRYATDHLLHVYSVTAHTMFPILHLPTFRAEINEAYRPNGPVPCASWFSLFFAVLACGNLFCHEPALSTSFFRPAELLEQSGKMIDPWGNDLVLDDVRTLTITAFCLNEMNLKSAAWCWIGRAARAAQDLDLQCESGPWPIIEGEMRRRTWWTIYVHDRMLASELGHTSQLDDEDCDISLPAGVDDHFIRDDGMVVPEGAEPLTHSFLAIIHVVRSYTALLKALTAPAITHHHLDIFDGHFAKCLSTFPHACDPSSTVPLAPHFLPPLAYLFHARLLLYRQNLSPTCPVEVRLAALENTTRVALETASLISRTNASIAEGATSLLVTHLFRCTLFLLLKGYFDHAATCVRALASIDAGKDVVISCRRYLTFFIATLDLKRVEYITYISRGREQVLPLPPRSPVDQRALLQALARDEELLAYVSTDAQGSCQNAWLWAGLEREVTLSRPSTFVSEQPPAQQGSSIFSAEARTGLTPEEIRDWVGWPRIEREIRNFTIERQVPSAGATAMWPNLPPPNFGQGMEQHGPPDARLQEPRLPADAPKPAEASATSNSVPGNGKKPVDRLSIANII